MSDKGDNQHLQLQIKMLAEHLSTIRRNMERIMAENNRLREVVRLAEVELRKRRQQVTLLEQKIAAEADNKQEVQARVDHAIDKLDQVIASTHQESSDA
ncbi:MAG: hypothetical protein CO186_11475 [Zetaproteobacteria bacterium CG_4_9_14_3_um_filter_49_83]|nr:MAG: hypothetical protein AUJ56_12105 [Zetaproteobacteria bacterium CG1_02_49_23]PIQ31761.1 MAG: hypothetical protein COW62_08855 [Zetaproteobacteria bacterium CG17_big_fil_post_rev_8_21_14_2_50_50_13]PIV30543.1 MAG: hypothetical protein COS35_06170 [Zetaproteobacteria bacterium CG02_land_8_20_14_3_00_50_9]PIY56632.1 MAG: hypothetical protein COZ00_03100 [Zetaproteobacteria bacterium CG_4_10_14_0_8_um_filter_49_80]PJA34187.1 MAG: hypothetical protein CO186_11475 [Zetaproteobacteria bacterium